MEEVQMENHIEGQSKEDEIVKLVNEKTKMREEFDTQRAKMKELYLQKEDELQRRKAENESLTKEIEKIKSELDDCKSQLLVSDMQLESNVAIEKRKAAEEIASLQHLVQETVEESSSTRSIFDSEIRKLRIIIKQLQNENMELKNEKQQSPHHTVQEPSSLAPSVVLSAVTKKLVKKLAADAFTSQDDEQHKEDNELLRSLVGPLEEEIKALKDKLRATDDQLQKCKQCSHNFEQEIQLAKSLDPLINQTDKSPVHMTSATNTSFDSKVPPACDMCCNYEAQLVREQKRGSDLEIKAAAADKLVERHKEELVKEIGFRKDMEEKWNEKKEEHKKQVAELTTRMECCEQDLKEVLETFNLARDEMNDRLTLLTNDRERVQIELDRLQKQNDNLVGKYTAHSEQLQSEFINLPDEVEELQELLLKAHQELIIAKIGKEAAEEECNSLRSEIILLKDKIESDQLSTRTLENSLAAELDQIKEAKEKLEKDKKSLQTTIARYQTESATIVEKMKSIETETATLIAAKRSLEERNAELKSRVSSLQQDLDTSEAVQKDFVRLSQSLQVELQKIRDTDTQVRWQHDEDIEECPLCRSSFSSTKRKEHCKHCGQIFCVTCLRHVVLSGPNSRPSKVCDVCHTLLVKSSAPYFSKEAPHSPD